MMRAKYLWKVDERNAARFMACVEGSINRGFFLYCSVPTFQSLPEEILSKLADVLEEVSAFNFES